jgi:hypothetical protein
VRRPQRTGQNDISPSSHTSRAVNR